MPYKYNPRTGVYDYYATQFGDVSAGNYSEFEDDGTLSFKGDATVYRDIIIPGNSLAPTGAAAPDLINFINANLQVRGFDGGATTERLFGSCEMQHDYKEGSNIEIHVHWSPTTADAGSVVWQLYYTWTNKHGTFAAPTLITFTPDAAGGTAWVHKFKSGGAISGAGKTIGSIFVFQLFRDPGATGDTYSADAALLDVGIHYECDTTGSRERTSK